jgi:hypothetical protein
MLLQQKEGSFPSAAGFTQVKHFYDDDGVYVLEMRTGRLMSIEKMLFIDIDNFIATVKAISGNQDGRLRILSNCPIPKPIIHGL